MIMGLIKPSLTGLAGINTFPHLNTFNKDKYCTKCGRKNENWNYCPNCGEEFATRSQSLPSFTYPSNTPCVSIPLTLNQTIK